MKSSSKLFLINCLVAFFTCTQYLVLHSQSAEYYQKKIIIVARQKVYNSLDDARKGVNAIPADSIMGTTLLVDNVIRFADDSSFFVMVDTSTKEKFYHQYNFLINYKNINIDLPSIEINSHSNTTISNSSNSTNYYSQSENTSGPVHVNGYYRKDGTYVRPHTRSAPKKH